MTLKSITKGSSVRYEPGTYDLRSWEIRVRPEERRAGVVHDVLVDERGRTRYLDVELEAADRHVLVPSGQAEAEPGERIVGLSGVASDELAKLPEYGHDPASVDGDCERRLGEAYERHAADDFYDRPDRLDDLEVAESESDPRGWEVIGADGKKLGKVHHLIGDREAMRVRYLTLSIDEAHSGGKRETLVPIGHAELDRSARKVRVPIDRSRVAALPSYEGGEITRDHERDLTAFFGGAYSEDRRYDHRRYRYERLYRSEALFEALEGSGREPLGGVIVVRRWVIDFGSGGDADEGKDRTRGESKQGAG